MPRPCRRALLAVSFFFGLLSLSLGFKYSAGLVIWPLLAVAFLLLTSLLALLALYYCGSLFEVLILERPAPSPCLSLIYDIACIK